MRPIKIYNPHLVSYAPLLKAIKFKGLIVNKEGVVPRIYNEICIQDKNLRIRGLNTCITYLDEKYPHPPFYPVEPTKRAVIRMMIDELIKTQDTSAYETNPFPDHFFAGSTPTILDIFLYDLSPQTELWDDFRNRFDNHRR